MQIQTIMKSPPVSVQVEDSVFNVARVLSEKRFHAVPVVNETEVLAGIITQYDLFVEDNGEMEYLPAYIQRLRRIMQKRDIPASIRENIEKFSHLKAKDIMTQKCLTLNPDTEIDEAIQLFRKTEFGSMPVIDGHRKLVGIVTIRDILDKVKAL